MDSMEAKMQALRKKMPSKRALSATLGQFVQQKQVAVLYTPTEQERIKAMTDRIAHATSEFESDEDWDRILKVVDALSNVRNRAVLKESIRFLRLRLGDPSPRVVILALTLTESIVKNCGSLVLLEVGSEAFMAEMEALHKSHSKKRGRDSMEITSRVLEMVQAWGEAFLPYREEYPLFVETYHNMRKHGVRFPKQYDETRVPVITPPVHGAASSNSSSAATSRSHIDTSSVSSGSSGMGGLSPQELVNLASNVAEMFEDMLYEAQKDDAGIAMHGVIDELATQAKELVHRMEGMIQIAVSEDSEDIGKYLSVNDSLNQALQTFEQLRLRSSSSNNQPSEQLENQVEQTKQSSVQLIDFDGDTASSQQDNQQNDEDDPFAEFVQARAGSTSKSSERDSFVKERRSTQSQQPTPISNQVEEDDPFASFVEQRAHKAPASSSVVEANKAAQKENDLINFDNDLLVDAPATTIPVSVVAASSAQPSLQFDMGSPALWQASPASSTSQAELVALSSSNGRQSASNPFDLLDLSNFSQKSSIASPAPAPPQPANPFDMVGTSSAVSNQPMEHRRSNDNSFNPFDF